MKCNLEFTVYLEDPKDGMIYQYVYADYETAIQEHQYILEMGYSAYLLVSQEKDNRRLSKYFKLEQGNC
jgi:hypothetical protein